MKKVLMTGATGFLGSRLAEALVHQGHDVTVLVRPTSVLTKIRQIENCLHIIRSVNPEDAFNSKGPFQVVIHTATCYGRDGEALDVVDANLILPLKLLRLMRQHGGGAFFNTDSFFTKSDLVHDYLPDYTITKKLFREIGWIYSQKNNLQFLNLTLEHLYGRGDGSGKFITMLVRQLTTSVPKLISHRGSRCEILYILMMPFKPICGCLIMSIACLGVPSGALERGSRLAFEHLSSEPSRWFNQIRF